MRRCWCVLAILASIAATPTVAASIEDELGPELMVIADQIVEKVIYGIRQDGLRGERLQAALRAWGDYYIGKGVFDVRQAAMIQIYASRAASRYQQGVPHVPYAERQAAGRE